MGRRLLRLVFAAAWLGAAFAAHVFLAVTAWPAWLAVPLTYSGYKVVLDLLRRPLVPPQGRAEVVFFEDLLRDGLVFGALGLMVVPLLHWADAATGTTLSPAVPLAAGYVVYSIWPSEAVR